MASYINHRVEKKRVEFEKGIKASQAEIDAGTFDGKQLQQELDNLRKPGTSNSWWTWRRIHTGRGLYASWKDDNFFKYLFKEVFGRRRSLPFLTAGISYYLLVLNLGWVSEKKAKTSDNWFPYGDPVGSKLPHNMHDLVEKDLGHPPVHQAVHLQKE